MLGSKKNNEAGYALIESLIGLVLLSMVVLSLIVVLPILLNERNRLDKEQMIYHRLFELHIQNVTTDRFYDNVTGIEFFKQGSEWCATYETSSERAITVCL